MRAVVFAGALENVSIGRLVAALSAVDDVTFSSKLTTLDES
jgi:hypothetical protein